MPNPPLTRRIARCVRPALGRVTAGLVCHAVLKVPRQLGGSVRFAVRLHSGGCPKPPWPMASKRRCSRRLSSKIYPDAHVRTRLGGLGVGGILALLAAEPSRPWRCSPLRRAPSFAPRPASIASRGCVCYSHASAALNILLDLARHTFGFIEVAERLIWARQVRHNTVLAQLQHRGGEDERSLLHAS